MNIKLSDFMLENDISDTNVSDIILENNNAKLDVLLTLMEYYSKQFDTAKIILESGPSAPPPKVPTKNDIDMKSSSQVIDIKDSPAGYSSSSKLPISIVNSLSDIIQTICDNIKVIIDKINGFVKFILAKKKAYQIKAQNPSKYYNFHQKIELGISLITIISNALSETINFIHVKKNYTGIVDNIENAINELDKKMDENSSSYTAFDISNKEYDTGDFKSKLNNLNSQIKKIKSNKIDASASYDISDSTKIAKSLKSLYDYFSEDCNQITAELNKYMKAA